MADATDPGQAAYDFYKRNDWVEEYPGMYGDVQTLPSMTRQEFAAECDINALMARYDKTGMLPANRPGEAFYYDFTEMPSDLLGVLAVMDSANEAFMTLPAVVRKEFDNDAARFLMFASDPGNLDQMRDWGLAAPKPAAVLSPVPPAAPVAPAPGGSPAASVAPVAPSAQSST